LGNHLPQNGATGALPTLYAATAPELRGGEYIGPRGLFGWKGAPMPVNSSSPSHHTELAARLLQTSETPTGVRYTALGDT
jgi:hypothetical protein